jgi:hypothetical protein
VSVDATPQGGRRGWRRGPVDQRGPAQRAARELWHLGPLWFMSNVQIATLAIGVLEVITGGIPGLVTHRSRSAPSPDPPYVQRLGLLPHLPPDVTVRKTL